MVRALAVLVGLALLGVSGCGGAERLSQSDELAVQACGIEIDDETGESTHPASLSTGRPAHETDQDDVLWWRYAAEEASSAAALDAAFEPLRKSTLTVYRLKSEIIRIWELKAPSTEEFYSRFTQADIDEHNAAFDEWAVECAALANRLNSAK